MCWKALDEIYKIYMLLHRSDLNILANVRRFFGVFNIRNAKTFAIFSNFVAIFADFNEICSDFLRFCRKCRKTLQLLEISRFQFNFHHYYTGDLFDFRLNFRFNFHRGTPPPNRLTSLAAQRFRGPRRTSCASARGRRAPASRESRCITKARSSIVSFIVWPANHVYM